MEKVNIRALTPDDMPRMGELLKTREDVDSEGAEKRLKLLEWLAFKNPYAEGEPTYFVADDGDNIVAHLGRMPMEFIINGKRRRGYYVHDLYVHPEYRAKGRGFFLSNSLYTAIEENSDSFCCLVWTTELNLELQRRRGYYETAIDRYYKFLNPYPKMIKVIRHEASAKVLSFLMQILLHIADRIVIGLLPARVPVTKIHSFDSHIDYLGSQIIQTSGICPNKTRDYLNWRFLDRPFGNMEVFVAKKDEHVRGYAVISTMFKDGYLEGVLVDIMADPQDTETLSSLYKAAVKYFRDKKVYTIRCCLSDKRYAKILKRFLFFKDFIKQDPVMLANLEKSEDRDYLKDINNWHITCCASDELMLEPLVSYPTCNLQNGCHSREGGSPV